MKAKMPMPGGSVPGAEDHPRHDGQAQPAEQAPAARAAPERAQPWDEEVMGMCAKCGGWGCPWCSFEVAKYKVTSVPRSVFMAADVATICALQERWRQLVVKANQKPVGTLQRVEHRTLSVKPTAFAVGLLCGHVLKPFTT